ncbi:hypothetical protein C4K39_5725 [Pseudomonas sessilinigenes]|nr:hypothetical protein C4K39_5725 [Pseudomonas sessilinigenes]
MGFNALHCAKDRPARHRPTGNLGLCHSADRRSASQQV